MCGIVGYIGRGDGRTYLLKGLQQLEYRGYDSSGIGFFYEDNLHRIRAEGPLVHLEKKYIAQVRHPIPIGIGHTRWATHGIPSERNAHPVFSFSGRFLVVHNGIIENYSVLKAFLESKNISFQSDTDTEILASYLEETLSAEKDIFEHWAILAQAFKGRFSVLVLDRQHPDKMFCMRQGSPMILGKALNGDFYLASDVYAFGAEVATYSVLPDNICLELQQSGAYRAVAATGSVADLSFQPLQSGYLQRDKGPYAHYMIKEIREQPDILRLLLRENVVVETGDFLLRLQQETEARLRHINRVHLMGCGTSYHTAHFGTYVFEELGFDATSDYAGEYKYRQAEIRQDHLYVFLSQSGETADVLAAAEAVKKKGALVIGITNVRHSSLSHWADELLLLQAGPEVSVASTKAFTAQMLLLLLLAHKISAIQGGKTDNRMLWRDLSELGGVIEQRILTQIPLIQQMIPELIQAKAVLFLGRNINYPVALEGALKLKEISYINGQGMSIGELKHGTLALVEEQTLCIALESRVDYYDKFISNIEEILARKGKVWLIRSDTMLTEPKGVAVKTLVYPQRHPVANTFSGVIFLQLIAYYTALALGREIDKPRNLAKSVTVE